LSLDGLNTGQIVVGRPLASLTITIRSTLGAAPSAALITQGPEVLNTVCLGWPNK